MPDEKQPFTEKELEALAREHGKPVREGFEEDVLNKVRSLQKEKAQQASIDPEGNRLQELEDASNSAEKTPPEQDLEK